MLLVLSSFLDFPSFSHFSSFFGFSTFFDFFDFFVFFRLVRLFDFSGIVLLFDFFRFFFIIFLLFAFSHFVFFRLFDLFRIFRLSSFSFFLLFVRFSFSSFFLLSTFSPFSTSSSFPGQARAPQGGTARAPHSRPPPSSDKSVRRLEHLIRCFCILAKAKKHESVLGDFGDAAALICTASPAEADKRTAPCSRLVWPRAAELRAAVGLRTSV